MAQTAAVYISDDGVVDHVAVAAITAGDVVEVGTRPYIAKHDIAAGETGALSTEGIFDVPKTSDAFTAGDNVMWNNAGNPVTGTSGSGAADSATGNLMGIAVADAASGASYVRVSMDMARVSTTIAGVVTADSITGSDSSLGIVGITGSGSGGGAIVVAGGDGAGSNENGGALTIRGGNAHGSGTDGVLTIGATNTSAINVGAAAIVATVAGHLQVNGNSAVTATTGGGTTGLIPAGSSFVTVTSDSANKQISLPAAVVGDEIKILVGTTGCELISAVAAHKVNEVTVGATNELALTAESLYTCKYTKTNYWIVTGETKLGAREAALVPDTL